MAGPRQKNRLSFEAHQVLGAELKTLDTTLLRLFVHLAQHSPPRSPVMVASDKTNAAPTKSSPVPPGAGPPQRYTQPAICVPTRRVGMGLWRCPASGCSPAASAGPCMRRTRGRGCPSKLGVDQHRLLGPVTVGVFPLLGPAWRTSSAAARQRDTGRTTDPISWSACRQASVQLCARPPSPLASSPPAAAARAAGCASQWRLSRSEPPPLLAPGI